MQRVLIRTNSTSNITIKIVPFIRFGIQLPLKRLLQSLCCFHILVVVIACRSYPYPLSTTQLANLYQYFFFFFGVCTYRLSFASISSVSISQHLTSPTSASCTFFWSFCYRFFCCSQYFCFFHLADGEWWTKEAIFGILNGKVHAHTSHMFDAPIDSPKMNNGIQINFQVQFIEEILNRRIIIERKPKFCISFFVFHLSTSIFPFDWNNFRCWSITTCIYIIHGTWNRYKRQLN